MSNLERMLNTWDEADSELNKKIDNTNLSTIVASATASASNSKTVEINGTGKNVEKLVIEGKTEQNGTPTPSKPVEVKGVGDKSRNLFDVRTIPFTGKESNSRVSGNMFLDAGTYTAFGYNIGDGFYVSRMNGNTFVNNVYSLNPETKASVTFTLSERTEIRFQINTATNQTADTYNNKFMLTKGSTAIQYEPYGKYKIPISVGGTTKNVYLDTPLFDGEKADVVSGVAEKKYIYKAFNGSSDENWQIDSSQPTSNKTIKVVIDLGIPFVSQSSIISDRFVTESSGADNDRNHIRIGGSNNTQIVVFVEKTTAPDLNAFKSWLTTNNLNVACELKTHTKETFDGAEIPTSVGKNTLTVGTDVTPTKVEATTFGDYYSKSQIDKMFADVQADLAAMAELL